jgi:Flp pilus assembly protein TadG
MTSPLRRAAQRVADAIARHFGRSQSGITFVLFAMAIVVILGMVAVGVDGARLFDERRQAQNAADHAAVTAAHAMCVLGQGEVAAEASGVASAGPNGYDDNPTSEVTVEYQGSGTLFVATIEATIPATFSHIIGWSSLGTGATAEAECQGTPPGSGPGALFSGGHDCTGGKYALDVSGQDERVYGGVHTNSDVNIGSKPNWWTDDAVGDPFEYAGTMVALQNPRFYPQSPTQTEYNVFQEKLPNPPNNDYPAPVAVQPWPPGYEPSVVRLTADNDAYWTDWRNLAIADGHGGALLTSKITSIPNNGVYYTNHSDGFDVSSVAPTVTEFTLIARSGDVKISTGDLTGDTITADAAANGIIALSGKVEPTKCSDPAMEVSANQTTFNGIFFAPGGQVVFSGQHNRVNGSLVGWSIRLNASNSTIFYDTAQDLGDQQIVLLN